jgi:hypothetical protein
VKDSSYSSLDKCPSVRDRFPTMLLATATTAPAEHHSKEKGVVYWCIQA